MVQIHERAQFESFADLLREYEAALPETLKHGEDTSVERVVSRYQAPCAAFLAMAEVVPIGCVAAVPLGGSAAILKRLFVRPGNRKSGAARMLVSEVIAYCRERAYGRIVLDTDRANLPAAYELYRSMGFTECAPFATADRACSTFMELRLK